MAVGLSSDAQLAEVLDDPVEDDRDRRRRSPSADGRSPRRRARASPSACGRFRSSRASRSSPAPPSDSQVADGPNVVRPARPRAGRSRPSRSRGIRDARGPEAAGPSRSRPTYPMIPHKVESPLSPILPADALSAKVRFACAPEPWFYAPPERNRARAPSLRLAELSFDEGRIVAQSSRALPSRARPREHPNDGLVPEGRRGPGPRRRGSLTSLHAA